MTILGGIYEDEDGKDFTTCISININATNPTHKRRLVYVSKFDMSCKDFVDVC